LRRFLPTARRRPLRKHWLLITEQLGFRYFMFAALLSARGATHELRFDNFQSRHRYCADRDRDLLPGPLRPVSPAGGHPFTLEKIAGAAWQGARKASEIRTRDGGFLLRPRPRGQMEPHQPSRLARAAPQPSPAFSRPCRIVSVVACAIHYTAARIARRGADRVGLLRQLDGAPSRLLSDRESQCLIQSAKR